MVKVYKIYYKLSIKKIIKKLNEKMVNNNIKVYMIYIYKHLC